MIARLMTIKDQLLGQIYFGVLYRKVVLWKDLDIGGKDGESIFAEPKVVEVHDKMNWYQQEYNCTPTRLLYEPIDGTRPGLYTDYSDSSIFKLDTCDTLHDSVLGVLEMETLMS